MSAKSNMNANFGQFQLCGIWFIYFVSLNGQKSDSMLHNVNLIHSDAFGRDIFACLWFWTCCGGDVMLLGILRGLDLGFEICSSARDQHVFWFQLPSAVEGSAWCLLQGFPSLSLYGHLFRPDPCMALSPVLQSRSLWRTQAGDSVSEALDPLPFISSHFCLCRLPALLNSSGQPGSNLDTPL